MAAEKRPTAEQVASLLRQTEVSVANRMVARSCVGKEPWPSTPATVGARILGARRYQLAQAKRTASDAGSQVVALSFRVWYPWN